MSGFSAIKQQVGTLVSSDLDTVRKEAMAALEASQNPEALEQVRIQYMGKKGEISLALKSIGSLPADQRKDFAQAANLLKSDFNDALKKKAEQIDSSGTVAVETGEDPSLPQIGVEAGSLHPVTLVAHKFEDVLLAMGYNYVEAPEIETEYNCFDALNVPDWHPARDMHDTFFIEDGVVLRTHTTAFQMYALNGREPPVRAFTFGRCFRSDKPDAGHSVMFTQLDLVAVDTQGVSFGHLKGLLETLLRSVFGPKTELRFRPSYFPFTGISAEVDATCVVCSGSGSMESGRQCSVCKGTGWVELLGSGVVRPEVIRNAGLDPDVYGGFAFGIGLERVAMLLSSVPDIRLMFESDARFLAQFPAQ